MRSSERVLTAYQTYQPRKVLALAAVGMKSSLAVELIIHSHYVKHASEAWQVASDLLAGRCTRCNHGCSRISSRQR